MQRRSETGGTRTVSFPPGSVEGEATGYLDPDTRSWIGHCLRRFEALPVRIEEDEVGPARAMRRLFMRRIR